ALRAARRALQIALAVGGAEEAAGATVGSARCWIAGRTARCRRRVLGAQAAERLGAAAGGEREKERSKDNAHGSADDSKRCAARKSNTSRTLDLGTLDPEDEGPTHSDRARTASRRLKCRRASGCAAPCATRSDRATRASSRPRRSR